MVVRGRTTLTADEIRDRVRAAGLRVTAPRVAVIQQLQGAQAPVTHAELAAALASQGWDRATIYRNLTDLTEVKLVQRTDVGDHVWRFELYREEGGADHGDTRHPHFVCGDCGEVQCLPLDTVRVVGGRGLPKSLKGDAVEIQVKGTCDRCA
jgi:Fur family ferric uptake transcriptional regulator